jgi:Fur family ferric uptake transcriptional regulator
MDSESLTTSLRQGGLRMTSQRSIILDVLAATDGHRHMTAQEVYTRAHKRLPGLNVTTVYRTLDTLHEAGLVDLMTAGGGEVRFAIRNPEHRHCHLVCRVCSRELEFDVAMMGGFADRLRKATGFRVDVDHVALGGVCGECHQARQ